MQKKSMMHKGLLLVVFLFLTSCLKTPSPRKDQSQKKSQAPTLSVKRFLEQPEAEVRPPLGLVLGPGLAHTWAHIGILKKFIEAKIPVHVVVGLGWSSVIAEEYANQGSVHGLEWKLSRSENFQDLLKTSFWSKKISPKKEGEALRLFGGLLSKEGRSRTQFFCPVFWVGSQQVRFASSSMSCVAQPPLFESSHKKAPWFFEAESARQWALKKGAKKVIYVDVLGGAAKIKTPLAKWPHFSYWVWQSAAQSLKLSLGEYDHVVKVHNSAYGVLSFDKVLDFVRLGEQHGERLVQTLKQEYQF